MTPLDLIRSDFLACEWDAAPYLLFSGNVGEPLVYYSHLFPAIAGLLLAFIIFSQSRNFLINRVLVFIALAFTIFALFDLILWATERPSLIMFLWSSLIYFEPLIYAATLYFIYIYSTGVDAPLRQKLIAGGLMLPIFVLAPTALNLGAYDYTNCDRLVAEGPIWWYVYFVEIIFIAWIAWLIMRSQFVITNRLRRNQVLLVGLGAVLFLISFSWGNITGTLFSDEVAWAIAQYGLFGMPVFLASIVYMIVRFNAFNTKLVGAEALVLSLWAMLVSLLFVQTIEVARPVIGVTIVLFTVLGWLLVRSVRREITQREHIEELARNLRKANTRLRELDRQKTEFVSIASHQLRSPLTAINGYVSLMLEGSFGKLSDAIRTPLEKVFQSGKLMAVSIDDFLNVTRIEQGRMKYDLSTFDLTEPTRRTVDEMRLIAEEKGLELTVAIADESITVHADRGKLVQVMTNIIDNSIKYTKQGSVHVKLEKDAEKQVARFTITDTGIGMSRQAQQQLFQKFVRANNANVASVHGTGLGLYIAKQMVIAHNGAIWGRSDGEDTGSEFGFEVPLAESSEAPTEIRAKAEIDIVDPEPLPEDGWR